jgi:two-component system cell cycle response regulator
MNMIQPTDLERARILIVDDCPDSAALLAELLALQNYHAVHTTTDAAVVCDLHEFNAYDLILLDMHMPYLSGLNIMAQLRKLAPDSFLPVIVLSGNAGMRLPALEAGAYDFMTKPYDMMEMTARIRNMLEVRLLYQFLDEQGRLQQNTSVYDPLTGLPGRRLTMDRIAAAIEHARRHKTMAAVLCIDIDGFRMVNDQYGRGHGDELLKAIASRLSHRMRKEDTVARIGGDAFLIVLRDIHAPAAAARPAQEILHVLSMPVPVGDTALDITGSIGIAIWPLDADDPEQLIVRADQALYEAKQGGRNRYRYANPAAMCAAPVAQDLHPC